MTLPQDFSAQLLEWYDRTATALPWRGSRDPYRIWLSEIMLQQTRITAVEPYYAHFLERFPTVQALAAAPLNEVLKVWEGLGYYARARNLHRLAQTLVNEHHGQFPATAEALQQLPGIGRYTAAALASIAFDEHAAVLDGNVIRVLARLTDLPEDITQPATQAQLWQWAEALLPAERPGAYNQALMDLGRTICTPRRPACQACPLAAHCLAQQHGTTAQRPVKKAKAPLPQVRAVGAVVRDEMERVLLVQRPPKGLLGGLWTLPGGLCEADESLPDGLRRNVRADLGLEIEVAGQMAVAAQTLTHMRLTLRAFACEILAGNPRALGVAAYNWVTLTEAQHFSLGKADRVIIEKLRHWQPRLFEEFE
ncbi:MAG: A/G-specific adenine glycosylase [Acidobacteria bacterium]|nr:A/G-specific adenine glycosylase [Acidobacteriota bacterium]